MTGQHAIEVAGLTKRYGSHEAVRAVTFQVASGGVTGFLGRNGAGKSTTLKMLLGMLSPTAGSGTVLASRIDIPAESLEIRRRVAYVGEDKGLYGYMTVQQMIGFTRAFYRDWQPEAEAKLLDRYALPLHRPVKALSKGMRTKLALLLALARRPALLILDEPTEGLDPVSIEELLQSLAAATAEGTTVFFSSHQLADVERIADDILVLERGALVDSFAMDDLRARYRWVIAGFSEPPPAAALRVPGVARARSHERQVVALVRDDSAVIAGALTRAGAVSVDVLPVTLKDVFLDAVQGDA